ACNTAGAPSLSRVKCCRMSTSEPDALSRRSFVHAIATAMGAAASLRWMDIASAAEGDVSFLSAAEAADIEAVAAQIIPTDDTPGAKEAGVIHFIDRALGTVLAHLATEYRAHFADFQAACRSQHPGAVSFASLGSEQQIAFLRTVE